MPFLFRQAGFLVFPIFIFQSLVTTSLTLFSFLLFLPMELLQPYLSICFPHYHINLFPRKPTASPLCTAFLWPKSSIDSFYLLPRSLWISWWFHIFFLYFSDFFFIAYYNMQLFNVWSCYFLCCCRISRFYEAKISEFIYPFRRFLQFPSI